MPTPPRLARATRSWRLLVGLIGLGVAGWVLSSERSQLAGTLAVLAHARLPLGLGALALETASDLAWAAMGYALIPPGAHMGFWRFVGITLAALAITNSIPFGAGASALYVIDQLRGADLDVVTSSVVVAASNLVAIGTLVALFALALVVHAPASAVLSPADDTLILVIGAAALGALWRLGPLTTRAARAGALVAARIGAERLAARARSVVAPGIPEGPIGRSVLAGAANWIFDFATLVVALAAVHAHVGLPAAASAYVVGALATNLPITPGGLGIVEGSITVALVAFGGAPATMLAAVILYRLASYWIWLPVGWASYFAVARRPTRA